MSGGGDNGGGNTTTTTTSEPWEGQKPYLEKLYKEASAAYDATPKTAYTGQTLADQSQYTQQAKDSFLGLLPTLVSNSNALQGYATDVASGKFLNSSSNPYLQDAMDTANRATTKTFQETTMPTINSAAIAGGAYGGGRQGVAIGKATDSLANAISDTNAKISYQNYATERGYQQNLPTLLSAANTMAQTPGQLLAQVGASDETYSQAQIQDAYNKWLAQNNAQWNGISALSAALGTGGSYGTATTTATGGGTSNASGILSGALGGGLLGYGALSGGTTMLGMELGMAGGPVGALIGTGLGALAGGLF